MVVDTNIQNYQGLEQGIAQGQEQDDYIYTKLVSN